MSPRMVDNPVESAKTIGQDAKGRRWPAKNYKLTGALIEILKLSVGGEKKD